MVTLAAWFTLVLEANCTRPAVSFLFPPLFLILDMQIGGNKVTNYLSACLVQLASDTKINPCNQGNHSVVNLILQCIMSRIPVEAYCILRTVDSHRKYFTAGMLCSLLTHCTCNSYQTRWAVCASYFGTNNTKLAMRGIDHAVRSIVTRENSEGMRMIV